MPLALRERFLLPAGEAQPSLTLTFAARGAILGNALFPNFTGYAMKIVNRLLPGAAGDEGNESRAGSETSPVGSSLADASYRSCDGAE